MAIESFFFKHDYNSRNDPKMVALRMKEGIEGIGIYWCIIELLYEEGGYAMLSECERIAFDLRVKHDRVKRVVCNYLLFRNDGTRFWSESALRRMKERDTKSRKAKESAEERWNRRKLDANALPSQSDSNAKRGEEKEIGEERIQEIGERSNFFVSIKTKYLKDVPKRIWNIETYFEQTQQLQQIKNSDWGRGAKFSEFMETNAGRSFDDDDHLYASFRKFCIDGPQTKVNGTRVMKSIDHL